MSKTQTTKLHPGEFYHLYNRAIGQEKLFSDQKDYNYFLNKFDFYCGNYLQVYSYCLLPNHFHFLVKIKETVENETIISKQLRSLFICYTMSINKKRERHGSLFERPFKRKNVESPEYLTSLIFYIHNNPVHHKICHSIKDWPNSSYHKILNPKHSKLEKIKVLDFFEGKENYINFHKRPYDLAKADDIRIE